MSMNLERLNINIQGKPSVGFIGQDEVVGSAMYGKAPNSYKKFLRYADGGHPEIGCFFPQGSNSENIFEVDWFYSIANNQIELLSDAQKDWGNLLGYLMAPIGRDGGGNQIYLDLTSDVASVWLYLHDENGKRLKIADSFEQFIDGLIMNPDFI